MYKGNKLKHAKQDDSMSCGLHLPSAVEHDLLNVQLCMDKTACLYRVRWFVCLGKAQTDHICHVQISVEMFILKERSRMPGPLTPEKFSMIRCPLISYSHSMIPLSRTCMSG